MLGHGKITFETPNVIDLGDEPPSRPSRQERKNYSVNNNSSSEIKIRERPNYTDREDHRKRFKPPLTRTIKLNYRQDEPNPQCDDDDDDDDHNLSMNDHDFRASGQSPSRSYPSSPTGSNHHSPGRDSARIFAEIMLAEVDRRESSSKRDLFSEDSSSMRSTRSSGAPMRWPRRGRRSEFRGLRQPASPEEDEGFLKQDTSTRRCQLVLRVLIALVTLAIVLCFSIIAHRSMLTSRARMSDSERLKLVQDYLVEHRVSKSHLLEDTASPQYEAAYWIAAEDAERLDVTDEENPDRFVQRYVLATLYFAMNGPTWHSRLHFVSDRHECSWFDSIADESGEFYAVGVSCDEQLIVRNLMIPSNKLKGQIPEEISLLTNLDFLSLKHNELTGSIPRSLTKLSLLNYLDFKYNQLTGPIPDFLGELDRLEVLGLSNNQLTGSLPSTLGSLGLKTLAIGDNTLTGDMAAVASMTNLQYLYAENNLFQGRLDEGLLESLVQLVEVDLSNNQFHSDQIPGYLFSRPGLRVLDLNDNQLAGRLPTVIPENTSLEYLSLRENMLSAEIPSQIQNLAALTHLDLEANGLSGTLPAEAIGKMTTLSYLFLGKNPMQSSTIPDELRSLKTLRELSLDEVNLTGPIPTWIENLSDLKLIDLRTNSLTGSVPINFSNLTHLSYLLLNGNQLTGPVPKGLGSRQELLVVSLHDNDFIGEAGLMCSAESEVALLTTDCGAIACPCCENCCDSEDCYSNVLWDTLENSQGEWEQHFRRSNYGFNPHILYSSEGPQGRQ